MVELNLALCRQALLRIRLAAEKGEQPCGQDGQQALPCMHSSNRDLDIGSGPSYACPRVSKESHCSGEDTPVAADDGAHVWNLAGADGGVKFILEDCYSMQAFPGWTWPCMWTDLLCQVMMGTTTTIYPHDDTLL